MCYSSDGERMARCDSEQGTGMNRAPAPYPSSAPAADSGQRHRLAVIVLFALVMAMLVSGLTLLLPYLAEELQRLKPWQAVAIWTADAVALMWFLQYCMAHVFGQARHTRLGGTACGNATGVWRAALISFICAIAADLLVTGIGVFDEWRAYQEAIMTVGRVTSIRTNQWSWGGSQVAKYTGSYVPFR